MSLHHRLVSARQQKGFTQEELADLTGLSVRTIQRIENGETVPRSYTVKVVAKALALSYEELTVDVTLLPAASPGRVEPQDRHFLQTFNLSCFAYLVIPWVHFLIPNHLLKKEHELQPGTIEFGRKIIRQQIYWIVTLHIIMLLTLAYNLIQVAAFNDRTSVISYLWPFLAMYFLNAAIIFINAAKIGRQA